MPSPFPGMDPYVEPQWLDIHGTMIAEARRHLNRVLPAGLVARTEERLAVESAEEELRRVGPDVRVFSPSTADPNEGADGGAVIVAPYKLVIDLDRLVERYIRIVDTGGRLVTVVEIVSPSNKRHPGLDDFREKRVDLLAGGVSFVEIDLVRAGNWRALMRPEACPAQAVSLYRATVRTTRPQRAGYLFPIPLRQLLPEVPIPLRPTDQPARIPLQPIFTAAYDDGRYDQTINYSQPCDPPLDPDDAAWADALLRAAGRR